MSQTDRRVFEPDYVSPPGETLRDQLAEMNLSQAELAIRMGVSPKHVNQIIQGNAPITPETAITLDRVTGIPARFWIRREADYRERLLRDKQRAPSAEDEKWLASLPIKELQNRGALPPGADQGALFEAVLSFFGVADRPAWERIWRGPVASFRRSNAYNVDPGAVIAWLRLAQIEAQPAKVEPYSASVFRRVLPEIRGLTAGDDPNRVVELCARAGVVVVFVKEVKGCRINGAAWWPSANRAAIALSDRYKRDDILWFTFFHEAAHILLHSKRETFVDDGKDHDATEDEADRFAADFLIPPQYTPELSSIRTDAEIRAFAHRLGIAPSIVLGRLQHDDEYSEWTWSRGKALRRPIEIVED